MGRQAALFLWPSDRLGVSVVQDVLEDLLHRRAGEWRESRRELKGQAAKGPEVDALAVPLAQQQLGGHVIGSANLRKKDQ